MDRHEVTNAAYAEFLEAAKGTLWQAAEAPDSSASPAPEKKDHVPERWDALPTGWGKHPVVGVDWHDADAYCRWAGKRLPDGVEWEWAARGQEALLYPRGNEFKHDAINVGENPRSGLAAVGSFPDDISPHGVVGMTGSVSEWLAEPAVVRGAPGKSISGASWAQLGEFYGLTFLRFPAEIGYRSEHTGFRCVKDADGTDGVPKNMVTIPSGVLQMGSEDSFAINLARRMSLSANAITRMIERPPRTAKLESFALDVHETTNRAYREFLDAVAKDRGGSAFAEDDAKGFEPNSRLWNDPRFNGDRQPVVGVTWHAARAYCLWRGKRLARDEEWEAAARGLAARRYPMGDSFRNGDCNTAEDTTETLVSSEVGSFESCVTPEGIYDLIGNADEWTGSPADDPDNADSRKVRGGSWRELGEFRGLGYLAWVAGAEGPNIDIGIRCAATPSRSWIATLGAWLSGE